ncbi:serine hydrolase [Steroidobacter sp.]|uniref:serine hydrolase n=1 Tax=Steroidobacter sp. TaxID=1978227 RepID=UPI001A55433A|nr:serine hydrolase [Steroidobacter sp.]MBL8268538.1 serine hydrolase [Steroidobacter sp.]
MNLPAAAVGVLALLTAVLPSLTSQAAEVANGTLRGDSLDQYIEQARADWGNVGVSVAVVRGDKVIYAKGFGERQFGAPSKVDADTLFQVGSTTKAFTAAALGILVDEGKLRWDDPVVQYLPEFELYDPWLTRHLSIRDTLTHRSGINGSSHFVFAVMDSTAAMAQLKHAVPEAEFRDSYRYDNLMYGVAGKVIEKVSGMSWGEFVATRLLQPLKMKRSGASPYEFWDKRFVTPTFNGVPLSKNPQAVDARDSNVAMPHLRDGTQPISQWAWQSYDNAAAAGSIVSSASDMAHWVILHLNGGVFEGRRILQLQTLEELHATQNLRLNQAEFPFEKPLQGYAMGWVRARYQQVRYLSHNGGVNGFPAHVAMLPDHGVGVVVLSNGPESGIVDTFGFHKAISFWVFDRLLKAPQVNWSREFLSQNRQQQNQEASFDARLQQSRLKNLPASLPLERYVGDYENPSFAAGPIHVGMSAGGLVLSFSGEGAFAGSLEHWHGDVFRLHPELPGRWKEFPTFVLDPQGEVAELELFGDRYPRVKLESKQ